MTTTAGDDEQRERAADDDGSDKEGGGGKGNGDCNGGDGQQRGWGQLWPLRWQRAWGATKRAMAMGARAMVTRVMGKRRQRE
jgi:hypothetical protein